MLVDSVVDWAGYYLVKDIQSQLEAPLLFLECQTGTLLEALDVNLEPQATATDDFFSSLRERIIRDSPGYLSFVYNKSGNHWAPCIVDLQRALVFEGDSMGQPPMPELVKRIAFALGRPYHPWSLVSLPIATQNSTLDCGIISINAIHRFFASDVPEWVASDSRRARLEWIDRRIQDHLASQNQVSSILICPMLFIEMLTVTVALLFCSFPMSPNLQRSSVLFPLRPDSQRLLLSDERLLPKLLHLPQQQLPRLYTNPSTPMPYLTPCSIVLHL